MEVQLEKYNDVIKDIAEYCGMGMDVYLHRQTQELIYIPPNDIMAITGEANPYDEDLEKVEKNRDQYFKFSPLESRQSFAIMVGFAEELPEGKLKDDLFNALHRKRPFANYKYIIDCSDVREDWFRYKDRQYEEYVERMLEMMLSRDEND